MNETPTVCIFYYDNDMKSVDGKCWCVKFSNSSTTNRFTTIGDAQMFFMDNYWNLVPTVV
jgi:hypothetical protein